MSNLAIDTTLLKGAYEIGGLETEEATVNLALEEFIKKRKIEEVLELFGKIEYDDDYDHKKARSS